MTTTVAQAHRQLVAEMDEAGDSPAEIAAKLGISVDRVESILDQQLDESDGRPPHPDDEHRAPAVEPVRDEPQPAAESTPIVVGSPARAPGRSGYDDGGLLMGDVAAAFGKLAAAREDVLTPARRPEGAVAHLSLPLPAAALIAVVDALELAYGPGIRVDAADGGVWVLGRAS